MTDQVVSAAVAYGAVRVTLLSGDAFTVPRAVFRLHPLKAGEAIVVEEYQRRIARDAYEQGMQKAVRALTARERTERELHQSLKKAGYAEDVIERIVSYLKERRYVDDERYANQLAQSMKSRRSTRRIAQTMQHKGIGRSAMLSALEHVDEGAQEILLQQLAQTYLRKHPDMSTPQERSKAIAHLVRKGFSYDNAREALQNATKTDGEE